MSLNRVVMIGRLTRDPEMRYTPQGIAVASAGIAVDRFTKNDQGEYDTDFFNIVAWRRSAEFMNNYLRKGRLVSIDGRLQARSWVDQQSGQKRTSYEIVVENIQGLDKKPDDVGGDAPAPQSHASRPASQKTAEQIEQERLEQIERDMTDESDPFADE